MSGGLPRFRGGYKPPKLDTRPELEKPNPDVKVGLPTRAEIRVIGSVNKRLDPLARVTKKFQVAGQPTLSFEVDDYVANVPVVINTGPEITGYDYYSTDYQKEVLQCCLHELMHMALWDDMSISHNPDKTSLLYYYVDGSVVTPNAWDLQVIQEASKRIGSIIIEMRDLRSYNIGVYLREAVRLWNTWVGREFYKLV